MDNIPKIKTSQKTLGELAKCCEATANFTV